MSRRFFNKLKRKDDKAPRGITPATTGKAAVPPSGHPLSGHPPSQLTPSGHPPSQHPPSQHPPSQHTPSGQVSSGQPPAISLFSGLNVAGVADEDDFTQSSSFAFMGPPPARQDGRPLSYEGTRPAVEGAEQWSQRGREPEEPGEEEEEEDKGFDFVTSLSSDAPQGFDFLTRSVEATPPAADTPTEEPDVPDHTPSVFDHTPSVSADLPTSRQGSTAHSTTLTAVQTPTPTSTPTSAVQTSMPMSAVQTSTPTSAVQTSTPTSAVQTSTPTSAVQTSTPTSAVQMSMPTSMPTSAVQTSTPTSAVQMPASPVDQSRKGGRKKKSKALRPGMSAGPPAAVEVAGTTTGQDQSGRGGISDVEQAKDGMKDSSTTSAEHLQVEQSTVIVEQSLAGIEQSTVIVEQSLADVKQQTVTVEQSLADVKQPTVTVEQSLADVELSGTNPEVKVVEQPTQVVVQSSHDIGQSTTSEYCEQDGCSDETTSSDPSDHLPTHQIDPETPSHDEHVTGSEGAIGCDQSVLQEWQGKLSKLLASRDKKMAEIKECQTRARSECSRLFSELTSQAVGRQEARKRQQQLKEEEQAALAEENYSRAEVLSQQIEEGRALLDSLHPVRDQLLQVLPLVKDKFTASLEMEVSDLTVAMETTSNHRDDLSSVVEAMGSRRRQLQDQETEQLKTFEDQVSQEQRAVARRQEEAERSEDSVEAGIRESCSSFQCRKEELSEEISTVEAEIGELEARLAELRERRAELGREVRTQEAAMEEARGSFAARQGANRTGREELAAREGQLREQQVLLESRTAEFESSVEAYQSQADQFAAVVTTLGKEVDDCKTRLDVVAVEMDQLSSIRSSYLPSLAPSERVQSLLAEEAHKTSLVQELADKVIRCQSKLAETRAALGEVKSSRPQLEEAKKAAVAGRSYKEAGRLNEELKGLAVRETDLTAAVEELSGQLERTSCQLKDLQAELAVTMETRAEEEKSEDLSRLKSVEECLQKMEGFLEGPTLPEDSLFRDLIKSCQTLLQHFKEEIETKLMYT